MGTSWLLRGKPCPQNSLSETGPGRLKICTRKGVPVRIRSRPPALLRQHGLRPHPLAAAFQMRDTLAGPSTHAAIEAGVAAPFVSARAFPGLRDGYRVRTR